MNAFYSTQILIITHAELQSLFKRKTSTQGGANLKVQHLKAPKHRHLDSE